MADNSQNTPHTILIVDDDKNTRERYKGIFTENGFNVLEAFDGIEGLNIAVDKKPNLIFTGIIMPKMDGFDLIKHLQDNARTANIPIMMSSHLGRQEDKMKAQELGIKDFIILDFTPPVEVLKLVRLRIEGDGSLRKYFVDIDDTALDAAKLTKDFKMPPYFKCEKHPEEKMVLVLSEDPNNLKEFKAKFICPREK
jgi:PleD family two-component response regulator